MILDTTFLIDVLRGADAVTDWERELTESRVPVVTAISVMELWEGVHRSAASDPERQRVSELLAGLTHAPFDRDSALIAGELAAALTGEGRPIDVEDVMIAAVALERDEPVLTRNSQHFDRVEGLAAETY